MSRRRMRLTLFRSMSRSMARLPLTQVINLPISLSQYRSRSLQSMSRSTPWIRQFHQKVAFIRTTCSNPRWQSLSWQTTFGPQPRSTSSFMTCLRKDSSNSQLCNSHLTRTRLWSSLNLIRASSLLNRANFGISASIGLHLRCMWTTQDMATISGRQLLT